MEDSLWGKALKNRHNSADHSPRGFASLQIEKFINKKARLTPEPLFITFIKLNAELSSTCVPQQRIVNRKGIHWGIRKCLPLN